MSIYSDEQNLAAGGSGSRLLQLAPGQVVTVSVAVKNLPKTRQIYAYLQFKISGKTITRYIGQVTAASKLESITLGWAKLRERQLVETLGWHWVGSTGNRRISANRNAHSKYRIDQIAALLSESTDTATLDEEALGAVLDAEKQDERGGSYKRADLLKMHAYRDAIRRTQGAYVVYPGQAGADKRLESFHEVLPGLGAFALRPGMGTTVLETFLLDVVRHVADRASAREELSFHTWQTYQTAHPATAQEHRSAYLVVPEKTVAGNVRNAPLRQTFVVVGWVKGDAHLQWIMKERKYNFRMGGTPGALRLSAQVVGATYLLLHGDDDRAVQGLFRIVNPAEGPRVYSKSELEAMHYPTKPTQDAYLVYDVEAADEFAGTSWDYAALAGKPATAALGHPFAISLQDLLLVSKR